MTRLKMVILGAVVALGLAVGGGWLAAGNLSRTAAGCSCAQCACANCACSDCASGCPCEVCDCNSCDCGAGTCKR